MHQKLMSIFIYSKSDEDEEVVEETFAESCLAVPIELSVPPVTQVICRGSLGKDYRHV